MPGRYGDVEPLQNHFSEGEIEQMLESTWRNPSLFIWKPQRLKCEGMWSMTNGRRHSAFFLYGHPDGLDVAKLKKLCLALAEKHRVDLGYIHLLAEPEWNANQAGYAEILAPFNTGFTSQEIPRCLPNLPWATYFGKPYVDLMRRERLTCAPVDSVELCGDGVYLQTTLDIRDLLRDYEQFEALRERVNCHLGADLFRACAGSGQRYRVPQFVYSKRIDA